MITASRFRLSSWDRGVAPPAWVKQSRNPVRRSSSMRTDAIGANGSSAVSSALSCAASAGRSSAVSGPITAHLLPRLIAGRTAGPLFLSEYRGRRAGTDPGRRARRPLATRPWAARVLGPDGLLHRPAYTFLVLDQVR